MEEKILTCMGNSIKLNIAFTKNVKKGNQHFLSACNITDYSRLISDCLMIAQYLEIEQEIQDYQMR